MKLTREERAKLLNEFKENFPHGYHPMELFWYRALDGELVYGIREKGKIGQEEFDGDVMEEAESFIISEMYWRDRLAEWGIGFDEDNETTQTELLEEFISEEIEPLFD